MILNRAVPLFLAGLAVSIAFRMGLFNIGVEGQYRLATILAAAAGAAVALPAPLHVLLIVVVAMLVGALWAGIVAVLKVTRGVSEVISSIMLNFVALGTASFLLTRAAPGQRAEGASIVTTKTDPRVGLVPRPQRAPHRAGPGRAALGALRLPARRGRRRRPDRRAAQAHPLRVRPAGHRPLAVGRHRQRRRRPRHGDQDDAALRCRRRADRPARPARRHPPLRHRVHRRPGLPRHRGRAARPQQPRAASPSRRCCSPSSTGPRCRCSSPTSRRRWSRSSRARSCSPSSSPTRSPAGWRCARPSGRVPRRPVPAAAVADGGGRPARRRTAVRRIYTGVPGEPQGAQS